MKIAVIDGQGGGIGSVIIKKIKEIYGEKVEVWALGTNAIATSQMLKAGANKGATGSHAICYCAPKADIIIGPISIIIAHAMMGEVTPEIALAIGSSSAHKLLLPLTQEPVSIIGAIREPLPHLVDRLVTEYLGSLFAETQGEGGIRE
ncbi:MAG: DUF3842 family protein [Thermodesulforhabdaceae bacterium]